MFILDLTPGLAETKQYKAWKFNGGEIHIKIKDFYFSNLADTIQIKTRLNSSDDLILLILTIDTVRKTYPDVKINVYAPYMAYQQADRDFSEGECFSLKTIANLINTLEVDKFIMFDAHSDVSPALINRSYNIDNSEYIDWILNTQLKNPQQLVILSPDAGAYKKIFKLASTIEFQGEVASANKSRSISTGNIDSVEISKSDFGGKDILIIDDICIGGRTFVELAKKLKERNVGNLYLAVSHGIFSNGFKELSQYFTQVFTTNSRRDSYSEMITDDIDPNFIVVHKII